MKNYEKVFLDTSYFIALLNSDDTFFEKASSLIRMVEKAQEVFIHEGIMIELGNWFSKMDKKKAISTIEMIYKTKNIKVITLDSVLFSKGFETYKKYSDKTVGLTDCISFVVMWQNKIIEVLTSDYHFKQAGFHALLLDQ